ncbi:MULTISPECIES: hypothetical protein [unclassified Gilliamella]|uniref:hypothetical protein n=1 Tax=unclassified Gilliamella TaxID=2685620 RepID=UPI00130AEDB7|nr:MULTISPECIES: hypothetical protein [unclassified Gilliamella]MWP48422.1 hypothetical protein [Gilliamella sp. Lep-s35]MWP68299.1 hypothetical protein [Gilliamella sp. Lep-s5]MWP76562.1 hypothetical protein [Gilliamella sp. Lep-s21]
MDLIPNNIHDIAHHRDNNVLASFLTLQLKNGKFAMMNGRNNLNLKVMKVDYSYVLLLVSSKIILDKNLIW